MQTSFPRNRCLATIADAEHRMPEAETQFVSSRVFVTKKITVAAPHKVDCEITNAPQSLLPPPSSLAALRGPATMAADQRAPADPQHGGLRAILPAPPVDPARPVVGCGFCGRGGDAVLLFTYSCCKWMRYCSAQHQKQHWCDAQSVLFYFNL